MLWIPGAEEQVVHHAADRQVYHDPDHCHEVWTGRCPCWTCGHRQDWICQRLGQELGCALRSLQLLRHHDQIANGQHLRRSSFSWFLGLLRRIQPHQRRRVVSLRHPSGWNPGCVEEKEGCHQLRRHAHHHARHCRSLHHYESHLPRPYWVAWQPQGSLQTYDYDGSRHWFDLWNLIDVRRL